MPIHIPVHLAFGHIFRNIFLMLLCHNQKVSFLFILTQANRPPKAAADSRSGLFSFLNNTLHFGERPNCSVSFFDLRRSSTGEASFHYKADISSQCRGRMCVIGKQADSIMRQTELQLPPSPGTAAVPHRFDGSLLSQKPYLNSIKEAHAAGMSSARFQYRIVSAPPPLAQSLCALALFRYPPDHVTSENKPNRSANRNALRRIRQREIYCRGQLFKCQAKTKAKRMQGGRIRC